MTRNVLLAVGSFVLLSVTAVADTAADRGFYVGLGYGVVTIAEDEGVKFSDADNANIQLGYVFSESFSVEVQYSSSTSDSTTKGTIEDVDVSPLVWEDLMEWNPGMSLSEAMQIWPAAYSDINVDVSASVDTASLYGVYRSSGNLYVKAKAGVVSIDTKLTGSPTSVELTVYNQNFGEDIYVIEEENEYFERFGGSEVEVSDKETEFTAGIGLGYKIGAKFFTEVEYTMLNDDLDYYSLGINYRF